MLNIDMPPVEIPSAVIVTTELRAVATIDARSVSERTRAAGTAFGEDAALAGAADWCVAEIRPTVDAEARTAARTLAPTTDRTPREETLRAGVDGTGDAGAEGSDVEDESGGGVAAVAGAAGAAGADGARVGARIGSGVTFDHSVMGGAPAGQTSGVVTRSKRRVLRRS
jgi:hypothetical protein